MHVYYSSLHLLLSTDWTLTVIVEVNQYLLTLYNNISYSVGFASQINSCTPVTSSVRHLDASELQMTIACVSRLRHCSIHRHPGYGDGLLTRCSALDKCVISGFDNLPSGVQGDARWGCKYCRVFREIF